MGEEGRQPRRVEAAAAEFGDRGVVGGRGCSHSPAEHTVRRRGGPMGSLRDIPDPPEMMLSTQASTTEDTIRSPTERCEADLRANRRAHGRLSAGGGKAREPGRGRKQRQ